MSCVMTEKEDPFRQRDKASLMSDETSAKSFQLINVLRERPVGKRLRIGVREM